MSEMNNNDEIIESTDTSFVRLSECQISDSFHHSTPKDHDIISKKDNVTEAEPTGILNNDDLPDAGRETITIRRNDSLDSDKTNYNALSGVACIMGYKTKKVLFVGVRNSYCSICARAEYKQIQPAEHVCYKNWTKSSTAMEADISGRV
ncbi:uncharacterized protein LOC128995415 [Macrosteles quadrilineatus]|uniref:uncharacterized protein LOC128995415 n=1 Tax=Macrosteles quadrilineatus TaxID=74068 RepID=UPI0023E10C37|nr:uncharacterized protein LOC128995415 [Macrosteles quadrilineatus]